MNSYEPRVFTHARLFNDRPTVSLIERTLRRQRDHTADPKLNALLDELSSFARSGSQSTSAQTTHGDSTIAVPLRIVTEAGVLSLLSTTMIFGTPLDVSLSELAVETFLPADAATGAALRTLLKE